MHMQLQEICCAQATSRTEDFCPAPLFKKLGQFFHAHFLTFLCSTLLLAAVCWQKGVNSPAMKYTNHPACMNVKPALSLLQCLRSRPATSSHGSRPQWSQKTGQLKIKAVYPCIQTTEPKLGTGSSDISNIQCLQSSQIPPYSLLKKLTLHNREESS